MRAGVRRYSNSILSLGAAHLGYGQDCISSHCRPSSFFLCMGVSRWSCSSHENFFNDELTSSSPGMHVRWVQNHLLIDLSKWLRIWIAVKPCGRITNQGQFFIILFGNHWVVVFRFVIWLRWQSWWMLHSWFQLLITALSGLIPGWPIVCCRTCPNFNSGSLDKSKWFCLLLLVNKGLWHTRPNYIFPWMEEAESWFLVTVSLEIFLMCIILWSHCGRMSMLWRRFQHILLISIPWWRRQSLGPRWNFFSFLSSNAMLF